MAKGKHSAALFEVIHSDKRFRNRSGEAMLERGGSLKTPKWWFKGRERAEAKRTEPAAITQPDQPELDPTAGAVNADPPPAPTSEVSLHPERNTISFRLTYTSAIIGGFTVLVIVVMAYMIGTRGNGTPAAARAGESTATLLQQPAQTGVLNVGSEASGDQTPQPHQTPIKDSGKAEATRSEQVQQPPPPPPVVEEEGFTMGRNYVIAQAYPDEKSAKRAAQIIIDGGVDVRVVRGPKKHANSSWYSVVGTRGFDRISGQDYKDYVARMIEAGAPLMKNSRFEQLKPATHKWVGDYGEVPLDPRPTDADPRR